MGTKAISFRRVPIAGHASFTLQPSIIHCIFSERLIQRKERRERRGQANERMREKGQDKKDDKT